MSKRSKYPLSKKEQDRADDINWHAIRDKLNELREHMSPEERERSEKTMKLTAQMISGVYSNKVTVGPSRSVPLT